MVGRLRGQSNHSSANNGTSHHSAEKLALFGATHLAWLLRTSRVRCQNQRADNRLAFAEGCKRQFALISQSRARVARYPPLPMTSPPDLRHHSTFLKRWRLKASTWARSNDLGTNRISIGASFVAGAPAAELNERSPLELDRLSARRPIYCPAFGALAETMLSTSRARDRRSRQRRLRAACRADQASHSVLRRCSR
jgi:hypothetical protein